METQQIIMVDKGADLWTNTTIYPFIDYSTGVRFEPGVHVMVKESAWMKGQPVIRKVSDLEAEAEAAAKAAAKK